MKILLLHTKYTQKGGEDLVFEQEFELLKTNYEVDRIIFHNKHGLTGALQFFFSLYNIYELLKLKRAIKKIRPDVIHLHNFHFAIGPGVIRLVKSLNIPLVVTLHNYRILCSSASLLFKDKLFLDSLKGGFPWSAIKNKVYRDSFVQTFWLAFTFYIHHKIGTWKKIDKIVVLTDFAKQLFENSYLNLDKDKIVTKPNFVFRQDIPTKSRGDHFLFIGRLSAEKGVNVLLNAFANTGYELRIAGDGPLKETVLQYASQHFNINYLGSLNKAEVTEEMLKCSALIFPSIWFEGMPMTLLEAFSLGTVPIVSKIGAMESMISDGKDGIFFEVKNPDDLAQKLQWWFKLPDSEKQVIRNEAKNTFETHYSEEKNLIYLSEIYQSLTTI